MKLLCLGCNDLFDDMDDAKQHEDLCSPVDVVGLPEPQWAYVLEVTDAVLHR